MSRQFSLLDKYNALLMLVFKASDIVAIIFGAFLAAYVHYDSVSLDTAQEIALLLAIFTVVLLFPAFNIYRRWRSSFIYSELWAVSLAWVTAALLLTPLIFLTNTRIYFSYQWLAIWVAFTLSLLILLRITARIILRWLRKRGYNTKYVAILGAGPLGKSVAEQINKNDWAGIEAIVFLDDDESLHGQAIDGIPVIGNCEKVLEIIGNGVKETQGPGLNRVYVNGISQVWIALPLAEQKKISDLVKLLQNTTASIHFVPDIFSYNLINHSIEELAGIPVVTLSESPIIGRGQLVKRTEDIVVSFFILILIAPLMVIIAFMIKLDSRGPALFKQRRWGVDGKEIMVWKFRSMSVTEDSGHIAQATQNDPRITKVGKFLRKTSLDELPQFFNVLHGDMSVVGPRPHAISHNVEYRKIIQRYMLRHMVKPGITGWAQINGWRGETETTEKMEKRIEYDLYYINNWSLYFDLKIIFLTVFRGFSDKNAY